jgi:hypothetical protein
MGHLHSDRGPPIFLGALDVVQQVAGTYVGRATGIQFCIMHLVVLSFSLFRERETDLEEGLTYSRCLSQILGFGFGFDIATGNLFPVEVPPYLAVAIKTKLIVGLGMISVIVLRPDIIGPP